MNAVISFFFVSARPARCTARTPAAAHLTEGRFFESKSHNVLRDTRSKIKAPICWVEKEEENTKSGTPPGSPPVLARMRVVDPSRRRPQSLSYPLEFRRHVSHWLHENLMVTKKQQVAQLLARSASTNSPTHPSSPWGGAGGRLAGVVWTTGARSLDPTRGQGWSYNVAG